MTDMEQCALAAKELIDRYEAPNGITAGVMCMASIVEQLLIFHDAFCLLLNNETMRSLGGSIAVLEAIRDLLEAQQP